MTISLFYSWPLHFYNPPNMWLQILPFWSYYSEAFSNADMIHLVCLPPSHPLCRFWHLTVVDILCCEALSCLHEVNFGHFFFFFPWFCIFPYGLFPYFKPWSSGILIYAFSLGSQSNIHSLTSPKSVTTSDHASPSTIPAGILSVTVSNSLLNSSASCHTSPLWPWTCSEMDLTILVHNPGSFSGVSIFVIGKRAEPQHYL